MAKKHGIKIGGQYVRSDNALVKNRHCCKTFDKPEDALEHVRKNYPISFSEFNFLIFQVER